MKKILLLLLVFSFCTPGQAQWTYNTLAEDLIDANVASSGSKIFFYSGVKLIGSSQLLSDQVEIFDVTTGTRELATLPSGAPRYGAGVAVVGNKIIFAGGYGSTGETTRVDIYDTLSATWSTAVLSAKRRDLAGTATATKAFFGGGFDGANSKIVDIYNSVTNTWSATQFPNAAQPSQRTYLTAIAIGNKVLFAGGFTTTIYRDLVSIYDANNDTWLDNSSISQTKRNLASIRYKDKAYFIGGTVRNNTTAVLSPSDTIDIYDSTTDLWSTLKIPRLMYRGNGAKRMYDQAVVAGCKIFIVPENNMYPGGATPGNADTIAVYDMERDLWSYEALPHPRSGIIAAATKNKVYFAGGANAIAPFSGFNHIDIYTVLPKLQLQVATVPVTDYAYDFGNVLTTDISHAQLNISNEGDYWLRFDEDPDKLSITGDLSDFTLDFTALQDVDTLEPAQSVQIPVSFHPQTTGEKTLTLQVSSDDPEHPLYSFVLKGNGTIANSTENIHLSQALSIYPVPCSDVLHIQLKTSFQEASLRLTDLSGKVILALKNIEADTALSTAGIPNGVYFLQIQTLNDTYLEKVVVTH